VIRKDDLGTTPVLLSALVRLVPGFFAELRKRGLLSQLQLHYRRRRTFDWRRAVYFSDLKSFDQRCLDLVRTNVADAPELLQTGLSGCDALWALIVCCVEYIARYLSLPETLKHPEQLVLLIGAGSLSFKSVCSPSFLSVRPLSCWTSFRERVRKLDGEKGMTQSLRKVGIARWRLPCLRNVMVMAAA
jgi:hypothetical protein